MVDISTEEGRRDTTKKKSRGTARYSPKRKASDTPDVQTYLDRIPSEKMSLRGSVIRCPLTRTEVQAIVDIQVPGHSPAVSVGLP